MSNIKRNKKRVKMSNEAFERAVELFTYKKINPKSMTNTEIANAINKEFGLDFDESAYRKKVSNYMKGFERGVKETAPDKRLEQIARNQNKLMEDRKILTHQRKIVHKSLNKNAKIKLIQDMCLDSFEDYVHEKTDLLTINGENNSGRGLNTPIYFISDIHYGLHTENKNNIYNPTVTKQRLKKWGDWVVEDVIKNGYKKIIISEMGDSIEGSSLRSSQLLEVQKSMVQQSLEIANILTDLFIYMDKKLIRHKVSATLTMVTSANHGQLRVLGTGRSEIENDDLHLLIADKVISNIKRIGNNSIFAIQNEEGKFISTTAMSNTFNMNINGIKVFMAHGHNHTKKGDKLYSHISEETDEFMDIIILGHFHNFQINHIGTRKGKEKKIIYLPAIVGDTHYGLQNSWCSEPSGLKMVINSNVGCLSTEIIPVK